MQRSQRIGLVAAAVVVAVAAFLLLKDGDDESSDTDKTAQTTSTPEQTTTTQAKPPPPVVPTIKIKDGKPVGGETDLEVDKGETLRFRVTSDAEHEIHLHGYDIEKEVEAGGQVAFKLKADIEGIFEIEIEETETQIGKLVVGP